MIHVYISYAGKHIISRKLFDDIFLPFEMVFISQFIISQTLLTILYIGNLLYLYNSNYMQDK